MFYEDYMSTLTSRVDRAANVKQQVCRTVSHLITRDPRHTVIIALVPLPLPSHVADVVPVLHVSLVNDHGTQVVQLRAGCSAWAHKGLQVKSIDWKSNKIFKFQPSSIHLIEPFQLQAQSGRKCLQKDLFRTRLLVLTF